MTVFLLPCLNSMYTCCTVRPCGKEPSPALNAWVMTLIHPPVWVLSALTCTAQEEKASIVSTFWVNSTLSWSSEVALLLIHHPPWWMSFYTLIRGKPPWHLPKALISVSFITLMMLLMVGVPRMTGIGAAKLDKSRITSAIWSSS